MPAKLHEDWYEDSGSDTIPAPLLTGLHVGVHWLQRHIASLNTLLAAISPTLCILRCAINLQLTAPTVTLCALQWRTTTIGLLLQKVTIMCADDNHKQTAIRYKTVGRHAPIQPERHAVIPPQANDGAATSWHVYAWLRRAVPNNNCCATQHKGSLAGILIVSYNYVRADISRAT